MNIRYPIYEGVYRILTLKPDVKIWDECWKRAIYGLGILVCPPVRRFVTFRFESN